MIEIRYSTRRIIPLTESGRFAVHEGCTYPVPTRLPGAPVLSNRDYSQ